MVDSKYKGFKLPKASFKLVNETLKALAAKDPYVPKMNKNDFNWDFTNQRGQKVYQTQALSARRAQSNNFNAKFEMMWSPLLSVDPNTMEKMNETKENFFSKKLIYKLQYKTLQMDFNLEYVYKKT